MADQLRSTDDAIRSLIGTPTTPWFRPPDGAWTYEVRVGVGAAGWSRLVMWDIDTIDWKSPADGGPTAADIVTKVLADAQGGRVIRHDDLVIDLERRRVQRGARRISLTPTEFEILRHLASRPGRVYTRAELLELLRDYEALDQDEKTINVHVSHLRDKIEDDPSRPVFVQTIRGVGYAFAER